MTKTRIYIVEDEALIAMELSDRLALLGYEIAGRAARGEQALEEIPALRPDLVLMDIKLAGGLTGIETAARLRARLDVPVVFLSAFSDEKLVEAAVATGSFGYLVKPFEERELHATLRAARYKHQAEQLLRADKERLEAAVQTRTAELSESEASLRLFRTLVERVDDAIEVIDPATGRFLDINERGCLDLGYTREEMLQLSVPDIDPQVDAATFGRNAASMFTAGTVTIESVHRRKDGTIFPVEVRFSHVRHNRDYMVAVVRNITRRKRTDAALRELNTTLERQVAERTASLAQSEAQLRLVWENALDGMRLADADGTVVRVNDAYCRLMRQPREALVGRPLSAPYAEARHAEIVAKHRERFHARQIPAHLDTTVTLRDGTKLHLELASAYIATPGAPELVLSVFRDVTPRRMAELLLRQSEEQFHAVFEHSPVVIALLSVPDGQIVELNAAALTAFGCTREETLGRTSGELGVWASPAEREHYMAELRAKGQVTGFEARMRRKNGEIFTVLYSGSLVEIAGRAYSLNTLQDITAVKQAEAKLAESERFTRASLDALSAHIAVLDADGRIIATNRAWREFAEQNDLSGQRVGVGVDYLDICDRAAAAGSAEAGQAAAHIRELIAGRQTETTLEYPCHSPRQQRWFICRGTRFPGDGPVRVALAHDNITHLKLAESALRESQERTRQIVDTALDAVITMDLHGRISGWNPQAEAIFGWKTAEAIGMKLSETIVPASQRVAHEHGFHRYLQSGESQMLNRRLEMVACRRDGSELAVDLTVAPVMIKGERQFSAFLRDITERKRSESAHRESEARLNYALDSTNDGLWDWNIPTGEVHFSPQWIRLLGFRPAEVPPRVEFFYTVVHPEDVERVRTALDDHLAGRTPVKQTEVRLRHCSGEYRWFFDQGKVVEWDAAGRPTRMVGTIEDISERKRAEAALAESEAQFRGVFDASPIPILLSTAPDGRLIEANAASVAAFGYTRDEGIGRTTDELGLWVQPAQRTEFFQRIAAEQSVTGFEAVMRTKAGVERIMLCTGTLLRIAGRTCVLTSAVDLTAVREAEAEKARLREGLFQSQKYEALGTLAGGVAHDFNNILTGILNYTLLAEADCPPTHPQIREFLAEVTKCGNRAKELVRQILLFSRAEEAERGPLLLQHAVRDALSLLRSTIPANVEIKTQLARHAPAILANATQIHQVVMNLGINAAHAMEPRGGLLTLALHQRTLSAAQAAELGGLKPGPHVCLEVTDNGSGMTPEVLGRIFEPFFTTKAAGEGTGLGLAVVRSIVVSHQGAIRVRSRPGEGTTFELFFPARPAAAPDDGGAQPALPRGRGQHILIVDDEPTVTKSVQLMLERLGYRVTGFTHPDPALAFFHAAPEAVDAVITDFQMPAMTGVELAGKILAQRPALPVFIASGFAGKTTPEKMRAEGVAGFLHKPFALAALAETLARTFAPIRGNDSPRSS